MHVPTLGLLWVAAGAVHLAANQIVAVYGQARLRAALPPQSLPLIDVGHTLIPRVQLVQWQHAVLEAWAVVPGLSAVFCGPPTCAALFLRTHAVVLALRPLCFLGTILPDASGVGTRPRLLSMSGGIHDLLFSGHVSAALCGILAWCATSLRNGAPWAKAALLLPCVLQSLLILATRKHYTVDVVVAWILCPLLCAYFDATKHC